MRAMHLYGAAEVGVQSGECESRNGLHYSGAGLVIMELIDPDTGAVKTPSDSVTGELVFTTLRRRACPLIRLRTHDIVEVFTEPCTCGRSSLRFIARGRSDDMFIVKGVNVFPLAVHETLLAHRPDITGEFCIVLGKTPPIDYAPQVFEERVEVPIDRKLDALRALLSANIQRS
jgi:phenylacetate-CoA ligase